MVDPTLKLGDHMVLFFACYIDECILRRSARRSKETRCRLTIVSPNAAAVLEELLARCAVRGVQLAEWRRPRVHNKSGNLPRLAAEWERDVWSSEEEIGIPEFTMKHTFLVAEPPETR